MRVFVLFVLCVVHSCTEANNGDQNELPKKTANNKDAEKVTESVSTSKVTVEADVHALDCPSTNTSQDNSMCRI